jgi:hypothetical protein
VSTKKQNNEIANNAFWKGGKSMPADGTLKRVCAERRVESFPTQRKYANRLLTLIQAI